MAEEVKSEDTGGGGARGDAGRRGVGAGASVGSVRGQPAEPVSEESSEDLLAGAGPGVGLVEEEPGSHHSVGLLQASADRGGLANSSGLRTTRRRPSPTCAECCRRRGRRAGASAGGGGAGARDGRPGGAGQGQTWPLLSSFGTCCGAAASHLSLVDHQLQSRRHAACSNALPPKAPPRCPLQVVQETESGGEEPAPGTGGPLARAVHALEHAVGAAAGRVAHAGEEALGWRAGWLPD